MIDRNIRVIFIGAVCALASGCASSIAPPAQSARIALPAAPPVGEPSWIAGLQASQLRVAFGTPAFVRKDGTAELWRYDGSGCKAFFFLYSDGNTLSVKHVETLPRGQEIAADSNCLNSLRRGSAPTS